MGGRKRVSESALGARAAGAGRTREVSSGMILTRLTVTASGKLPQWPWQPEDLQQSCFVGCAGSVAPCAGHAVLEWLTTCFAAALAMSACTPTAS
jgi:hypothetical protein